MQRELSPSEALCHALNQINQTAHCDAIVVRGISADRSRLHSAHVRWLNDSANLPGFTLAEAMKLHDTPFEGRPLHPGQLHSVLARLQQIESSITAARKAALADGASLLDADEHKATTVDIVQQLRVAGRLVSGLRHTLQMPTALCADEADELQQFGEWCGTMSDRLTAAIEVEAFARMRKHSEPDLLKLKAHRKERQEILERLRTTIHRAHGSHRDLLEEAGRYWDSQCDDALKRSLDPEHSDAQFVAVLAANVYLTNNPPDYTRLGEQDRALWAARVSVLAWVLMDPDACKSPIQLTALQHQQWMGEQGYDPKVRPQEGDEYVPLHVIVEALDTLCALLESAVERPTDSPHGQAQPTRRRATPKLATVHANNEPAESTMGALKQKVARLGQKEKDIIRKLASRKHTGMVAAQELPGQEKIAAWVGCTCDSQFKASLATLVKAGLLDNGRHHGRRGGYFLTPEGERAEELFTSHD